MGGYLQLDVVTCIAAGDFVMINCDTISSFVVKTVTLFQALKLKLLPEIVIYGRNLNS